MKPDISSALFFNYICRFGILFVTEADENIDGKINAAVGIARAFYFINNDESSAAAFAFLTKVLIVTPCPFNV